MSDEIDQQKRERLQDMYPDTTLIFYDDLDEAMIGVVTQFGVDPRVCYDYYRCLGIYQERDGMSHEGAMEHFNHNVIGGYNGTSTPCFLEKTGTISDCRGGETCPKESTSDRASRKDPATYSPCEKYPQRSH